MKKEIIFLNSLDDVLEVAGNKFGPILLDELHNRLGKTVKLFDSELKELLKNSFEKYHLSNLQVRSIIDQNYKPIEINEYKEMDLVKEEIPEFIKDFDKKYSNN